MVEVYREWEVRSAKERLVPIGYWETTTGFQVRAEKDDCMGCRISKYGPAKLYQRSSVGGNRFLWQGHCNRL